jgi:hypothetical protein
MNDDFVNGGITNGRHFSYLSRDEHSMQQVE